ILAAVSYHFDRTRSSLAPAIADEGVVLTGRSSRAGAPICVPAPSGARRACGLDLATRGPCSLSGSGRKCEGPRSAALQKPAGERWLLQRRRSVLIAIELKIQPCRNRLDLQVAVPERNRQQRKS